MVLDHTHVVGRFTGAGNDDAHFKVQAIESPETFIGRVIPGDVGRNSQITINDGQALGGPNEDSGILTTVPVEKSTVADGNMMPYAVALKIIKT